MAGSREPTPREPESHEPSFTEALLNPIEPAQSPEPLDKGPNLDSSIASDRHISDSQLTISSRSSIASSQDSFMSESKKSEVSSASLPSLFRTLSAPTDPASTKPEQSPIRRPQSEPNKMNKLPEKYGDFSPSDEDPSDSFAVPNDELVTTIPIHLDLDDRIDQEKKTNPDEIAKDAPADGCFTRVAKFSFATLASATYFVNSLIGGYKFTSNFIVSFDAPKNFGAFIKNGFKGLPVVSSCIAFPAAFASQGVNTYQTYDFGKKAVKNLTKFKPVLKKVKKCQSLTRKETATLGGLGLSVGAAGAAGKLALDAYAKADWYLKYIMGTLSASSFFVMTLITRWVLVQKIIDKIGWFYANNDKAYALNLLKALTRFHSTLSSLEAIEKARSNPAFDPAKKALIVLFKKYEMPPPTEYRFCLNCLFCIT